MKKRSRKKSKPRETSDAQVREFEKRDLGTDVRESGAAYLVRPHTRPTSILLDDELIAQLRAKGARRGLGYQTMLKMILREHLDEY